MAGSIWFHCHQRFDGIFRFNAPEYNTQEARAEYADYHLQDSRFIYKDADNDDQPGAFLSEYMVRIFAAHISAIVGKVRVDALGEFGAPGYQTALALTAAAVSPPFCSFALVTISQ